MFTCSNCKEITTDVSKSKVMVGIKKMDITKTFDFYGIATFVVCRNKSGRSLGNSPYQIRIELRSKPGEKIHEFIERVFQELVDEIVEKFRQFQIDMISILEKIVELKNATIAA